MVSQCPTAPTRASAAAWYGSISGAAAPANAREALSERRSRRSPSSRTSRRSSRCRSRRCTSSATSTASTRSSRQVVNNASGSLRPLVEQLFAASSPTSSASCSTSSTTRARPGSRTACRRRRALRVRARDAARAVELMRELAAPLHAQARRAASSRIRSTPMFRELLFARELERTAGVRRALIDPFVRHDRDARARADASRTSIRNLAVGELVVAGDLGDRGPRIDKVIELLMQQPNVAITWGNHDAELDGRRASGIRRAIATVVRLSLRYRRLAQLEEGYGISLAPVERLARDVYGDDPAERFAVKGEGLRDPLLLARMQKAVGDPAVQARGRAVPPPHRVAARAPRAAPPHRSGGRHRRARRHDAPAARHALADDRLGRSVRAVGRRAALPRPR